ncbi:MerR family transcriptional regulator [Roseiterribacter gracilis]|uniref:HTH-type transcriptional regulator SkgA n=1 Tax=Roseiterribacter gracilis TaxID=2812848 RepID=A0A8S8X946_9PROT|nr:HTH-type transcriptional regulator SkgA [Rhodospirillales bacterium TMPK1]
MERNARTYTVKQVASWSGVSIRTLHFYDEIGLLRPAEIGANGYRYYGRDELLRLQQILLYRELDVKLTEIARLLDASSTDRVAALQAHRLAVEQRGARLATLLRTIDSTIADLRGETVMDERGFFDGFDPATQARLEQDLVDRFGEQIRPHIEESRAKRQSWSRDEQLAIKNEGDALTRDLAVLAREGAMPDEPRVLAAVRRHHDWVAQSWAPRMPTRISYSELAKLYVEHEQFRAHYDGFTPGLADWLAAAMKSFAERELA